MRKFLLIASAAALLGAGGCSRGIPTSDAAAVRITEVSPTDLQSAVSDERVRRFYEARGWRAVWTPEAAGQLVQALRGAVAHGLDPAVFLQPVEQAVEPAPREASLTRAALDYGDALANGLTDPDRLYEIYGIPKNEPDLVAGLGGAVDAGNIGAWLNGLAPGDAEYRALSQAYLQYLRQASEEQSGDIRTGNLIRPGSRDPRLPRIVEAMRANGYLADGQGTASDRYTAPVVQAVRRMQADYAIETDGLIGPDTLEALNTGARERARTLAVNLERRRWLDRQPAATRIDVNTAAAVLSYWRDGQFRDTRRVVVGQPDWETPQLHSPIFRLVANPEWTVPESIEEEEIAPKGAGYMAANNMIRRNGRIVQLPGPENALGLVKFDMQNDHAIYLHDTPAKPLFQQSQRHFSHGCVRVDDALGFARMLAESDGKAAEFERALATGEETFVNLGQRIPVRLLYHTAFLDPSGAVMFRTDPYGWDSQVAQALGRESWQARRFNRRAADVGP